MCHCNSHVAYSTPTLFSFWCVLPRRCTPPVGKIPPTMPRLAAIYLSVQQTQPFLAHKLWKRYADLVRYWDRRLTELPAPQPAGGKMDEYLVHLLFSSFGKMRHQYLIAWYVLSVRVTFLSRPGLVLKGDFRAFGIMLKELEHVYALLPWLMYNASHIRQAQW